MPRKFPPWETKTQRSGGGDPPPPRGQVHLVNLFGLRDLGATKAENASRKESLRHGKNGTPSRREANFHQNVRCQKDGPKMAPRSPKMAQDGPNMASRWLQDGFKTAHMAPRWLQDGPQWPLHGPKMAPDGLRRPLGGPRWPKTGPKWPQDGLQTLHDRRKMTPISLLHNIYLLNACQLPGRLLKMGRPFAFVGFRWSIFRYN